ncbi:dTDP-glucose 4,6-dehydratase [Actinocatenispora rupis]|uniref:dTDP-glucose 4,6-dehydratase n=1 Tax=Actinocatenispora rupis TaxID=519421 RepID=A0A8J3NCV5_9ACTN|nr:dTDP-glucose 4,6-dehydratase [Actinocatenispora rupis]GID12202.1 dTDP-glucose 4,6-dehydratase [Actinocatenispora rupis]
MRVLVTGGAGFIGSTYVRSLLTGRLTDAVPDEVVILDSFTYAGNRANLAPVADDPRLRVVAGDIADVGAVEEVMAGTDTVVHFAAESHVDRSIAGSAEFVRTNVVGTHCLLAAALAAGVRRFVHVSTDEVYGSVEHGAWPETHPLGPNSPYAASKAAADLIARSYFVTHRLPVLVTRCSNNYGPYQHPEKFVPMAVCTLLGGGTVPLYGDGRHVREWLYVDDHCRGIQLVAERGRPGEIYNIGGGTALTNRDLLARLLMATGAGWDRVRYVPDRKAHDRRYALDTGKIRRLGYRPTVGMEDGLVRTLDWYATHRQWWEPLRAGTSVGQPG